MTTNAAAEAITDRSLMSSPEIDENTITADHALYSQCSLSQSSLANMRSLNENPPTAATNQEVNLMLSGFQLDTDARSPISPAGDGHDGKDLRVAYPWNPSDNIKESYLDTMARHDLVFDSPGAFKLAYNSEYKGLATGFTEPSIEAGLEMRAQLKEKNPNIKLLTEIRYKEAPEGYLPADSKWWSRDAIGQLEQGYDKKGQDMKLMDFTNPQFQDQIAQQAKAAVQSGVVDGVMLDCFHDGLENGPKYDSARLQLLTKIREAIGPDKLILVNSNETELPLNMTNQVNGFYMECPNSNSPKDWVKIAQTLDYAEEHTRAPHVNVVETWIDAGHDRNDELNKMRATMTLVMTHAPDGYAVFGDANQTSKVAHAHSWYDFYNTDVGAVTGPRIDRPDGSTTREYANGTVLYNPAGNKPVEVHFNEPRKEAGTGEVGRDFTVNGEDGDIFLKM